MVQSDHLTAIFLEQERKLIIPLPGKQRENIQLAEIKLRPLIIPDHTKSNRQLRGMWKYLFVSLLGIDGGKLRPPPHSPTLEVLRLSLLIPPPCSSNPNFPFPVLTNSGSMIFTAGVRKDCAKRRKTEPPLIDYSRFPETESEAA